MPVFRGNKEQIITLRTQATETPSVWGLGWVGSASQVSKQPREVSPKDNPGNFTQSIMSLVRKYLKLSILDMILPQGQDQVFWLLIVCVSQNQDWPYLKDSMTLVSRFMNFSLLTLQIKGKWKLGQIPEQKRSKVCFIYTHFPTLAKGASATEATLGYEAAHLTQSCRRSWQMMQVSVSSILSGFTEATLTSWSEVWAFPCWSATSNCRFKSSSPSIRQKDKSQQSQPLNLKTQKILRFLLSINSRGNKATYKDFCCCCCFLRQGLCM